PRRGLAPGGGRRRRAGEPRSRRAPGRCRRNQTGGSRRPGGCRRPAGTHLQLGAWSATAHSVAARGCAGRDRSRGERTLMTTGPDAVLLIAFGGPERMADVEPFLANVVRGRRVAPGRLKEVVHHYELFDGRSPMNELTFRQARALEADLAARGPGIPVYVGMRNWTPYLHETLARMRADGIHRALGIVMAPQRSYSSWD